MTSNQSGAKLSRAIILFALFSCAGWLYETIENIFTFGGFYLRAQLMLPWCPIYGIGGLVIVALLDPLRRKLRDSMPAILQFLIIALGVYVLAAAVELAGSYVCEWAMGFVPWDYSDAWGNFQGRIAPQYTMRFLILGLIALYVVLPVVTWFVEARPNTARNAAIAIVVALVVDFALDFAGVWAVVKDGLAVIGIKHW